VIKWGEAARSVPRPNFGFNRSADVKSPVNPTPFDEPVVDVSCSEASKHADDRQG
jgi:hypothetical protein